MAAIETVPLPKAAKLDTRPIPAFDKLPPIKNTKQFTTSMEDLVHFNQIRIVKTAEVKVFATVDLRGGQLHRLELTSWAACTHMQTRRYCRS